MKPSDRTTRRRRVFIKTPGGKTKKRVKGKTKSKPVCGECGQELHGVKTGRVNKSKKKSFRPYPYLCSKCSRKKLVQDIKNKFSEKSLTTLA